MVAGDFEGPSHPYAVLQMALQLSAMLWSLLGEGAWASFQETSRCKAHTPTQIAGSCFVIINDFLSEAGGQG